MSTQRGSWIPWVFAGLMGVVVAVNGVLITAALGTYTGTTSGRAYDRGLHYGEVLEEAARQQALGWQAELAVEPGALLLRARDRAGAPLPAGLGIAARLQRPLVTDVVAFKNGRYVRPVFQGKLQAELSAEGPAPHLVTLQIGAFRADAMKAAASVSPVRAASASLDASKIRQKPEAPFKEAKQAVDLSQAERIVAVGRGIKGQEHLQIAQQLAQALGAELAASRPICDAGWLPMDRQIGSSGQTVAPKLYVALGISGAIQHLVGMKGSKTIVAVNKDPEAPIFEIADYGIAGDLFEIVPAIIAELAKS
jgi:electron transfer flavoprotein alpha subunit